MGFGGRRREQVLGTAVEEGWGRRGLLSMQQVQQFYAFILCAIFILYAGMRKREKGSCERLHLKGRWGTQATMNGRERQETTTTITTRAEKWKVYYKMLQRGRKTFRKKIAVSTNLQRKLKCLVGSVCVRECVCLQVYLLAIV